MTPHGWNLVARIFNKSVAVRLSTYPRTPLNDRMYHWLMQQKNVHSCRRTTSTIFVPNLQTMRSTTRVMRLARRARQHTALPTTALCGTHYKKEWSESEIQTAAKKHAMSPWVENGSAQVVFARSSGVFLYDTEGKEYLDWTSQAVCTNIGHSVPEEVLAAVTGQLRTLPMLYGGLGMCEIRARMAQLVTSLLPSDIDGVLFPSSGAEANEVAIRVARRFTGKHKIMSHDQSYHGATLGALNLTGDSRHKFVSPDPGFVKVPHPPRLPTSPLENSGALAALEVQILQEGADTVAAIVVESITGSGGVFVADASYMLGVRELCDKYGMLLIADEVMVGVARTGRLWGFQHFEGFVPDIVTAAKGLSGAYLPLSMVAMRRAVQLHFEEHAIGWGSTYQAHPVALACGYAVMKHVVEKDLAARSSALGAIMHEEIQRTVASHSILVAGRSVGLFACVELHPASGVDATAVRHAMMRQGLLGIVRYPYIHCAPPLVISEDELRYGFRKLHVALRMMAASAAPEASEASETSETSEALEASEASEALEASEASASLYSHQPLASKCWADATRPGSTSLHSSGAGLEEPTTFTHSQKLSLGAKRGS